MGQIPRLYSFLSSSADFIPFLLFFLSSSLPLFFSFLSLYFSYLLSIFPIFFLSLSLFLFPIFSFLASLHFHWEEESILRTIYLSLSLSCSSFFSSPSLRVSFSFNPISKYFHEIQSMKKLMTVINNDNDRYQKC